MFILEMEILDAYVEVAEWLSRWAFLPFDFVFRFRR